MPRPKAELCPCDCLSHPAKEELDEEKSASDFRRPWLMDSADYPGELLIGFLLLPLFMLCGVCNLLNHCFIKRT